MLRFALHTFVFNTVLLTFFLIAQGFKTPHSRRKRVPLGLGGASRNLSEQLLSPAVPNTPAIEQQCKSILVSSRGGTLAAKRIRREVLSGVAMPRRGAPGESVQIMGGLAAEVLQNGGTRLVAHDEHSVTVPVDWQAAVHKLVVVQFLENKGTASHQWQLLTEATLEALDILYFLLKRSVPLPLFLSSSLVRARNPSLWSLDKLVDCQPEPFRAFLRLVSIIFREERKDVH